MCFTSILNFKMLYKMSGIYKGNNTRILSGHVRFRLYQRTPTTSKHLSVVRKKLSHTRTSVSISAEPVMKIQ